MVRHRVPVVARLAALLAAVGVAIWAGTLVRHHLQGPDPVAVVRAATEAYAAGDCEALRKVSESGASVDCEAVTQVQEAYRREGLHPSTFSYRLVSRSGEVATVRIGYRQGGRQQQELIAVEKGEHGWKVAEVGSTDGA